MPMVSLVVVNLATVSRMSWLRPRKAASRSGCGPGWVSHRPLSSLPNRAAASSRTDSKTTWRSSFPLISEAMRLRAWARVTSPSTFRGRRVRGCVARSRSRSGSMDPPLPATHLGAEHPDRRELPARAPRAHGRGAHTREGGRFGDRQHGGVAMSIECDDQGVFRASTTPRARWTGIAAAAHPGRDPGRGRQRPGHRTCGHAHRRWPRSTPVPSPGTVDGRHCGLPSEGG